MEIVLCSKEFADEYSLMHFRTRGSKNGVRRYQYKNGKLTPEGYQHYKEMYGWGERKTRAAMKSEKYQSKADSAHDKTERAQYRNDKLTLKADHHPDNTRIATKKARAESDLAKNRMKETTYQQKAYKYASKDQKDIDRYFNEDGTLNEAGKKKYTYSNGTQQKMNLAGRLKFGNKFAEEYESKERTAAEKRGDTDRAKVDAEFDRLNREEDAERAAAKEEETRQKNVDYFAGKYGWNKQNQRDLEHEIAGADFDGMSSEEKKKLGDAWLDCLSTVGDEYAERIKNNEIKPGSPEYETYYRLNSWMTKEIDRVAGNENTGEYKEGSRAEKAHQKLMKDYDEAWARREAIEKEIGYKQPNYKETGTKKVQREYARLKEALASDAIWKALNENSQKSEQALLGAVLADLGFSNTPENRKAIYWIVFRD